MSTVAAKKEDRPFNTHKAEYITAMLQRSTLDPRDIEEITDFIEEKTANENGISLSRERKIWFHLIEFQRAAGIPLHDLTWKPLIKTMNTIRKSGRFKKNTFRDTVAILKMYLKWLIKQKKAAITFDEIMDLKLPKEDKSPIRPEDLITDEEKDGMIKACLSPRDAAIISLMWEAGLRPIEVGHLRAADIEFPEDGGMIIYVKEKTDRTRRIPAPVTAPFVKTWFDFAPYPMKGDALVFPCMTPTVDGDGTRRYLPMKDDALRIQLKAIAKRAGITRRIIPYMFRHTAISDMINKGVPEQMVMKLSHGGATQMMAKYWHADDQLIEGVVLEKRHGIKSAAKKVIEEKITERKCSRCGRVVSSTFEWCPHCRAAMTMIAAKKTEDLELEAERYYASMTARERDEVEDRIAEKVAAKLAARKVKSL
ncbi:MAG: tyrosine-type recombinase/integrase [Methanolinea sp.]